ncbi:hypothetical protein J6590_016155 [Homalodisca vitripennis]|nr:hypothetical protein J6590_016155 [Homalodisca vitripennis]
MSKGKPFVANFHRPKDCGLSTAATSLLPDVLPRPLTGGLACAPCSPHLDIRHTFSRITIHE